jgi:hypothetical protein
MSASLRISSPRSASGDIQAKVPVAATTDVELSLISDSPKSAT